MHSQYLVHQRVCVSCAALMVQTILAVRSFSHCWVSGKYTTPHCHRARHTIRRSVGVGYSHVSVTVKVVEVLSVSTHPDTHLILCRMMISGSGTNIRRLD